MRGPRRYRKKPVTIEAIRWDGSVAGATIVVGWVLSNGGTASYDEGGTRQIFPGDNEGVRNPSIRIDTLEGTLRASGGDYVIKGIQGEFYPCKPDIFTKTYEPP